MHVSTMCGINAEFYLNNFAMRLITTAFSRALDYRSLLCKTSYRSLLKRSQWPRGLRLAGIVG